MRIFYKTAFNVGLYVRKTYCATIEVWEWMSNLISHFSEHVITYPWLSILIWLVQLAMSYYEHMYVWCIGQH